MWTWNSIGPCVGAILGISVLSSKRNHLLSVLLSLEFISLNILALVVTLLLKSATSFFALLFLVVVVCEGALGLGLLISLVRASGNDLVKSLYLLYF